MIDADLLADALLDPANDAAVRKATEALAAHDAFPPMIREAYGREARRIARRAAVALVELLEVAEAERPGREGGLMTAARCHGYAHERNQRGEDQCSKK